MRSPILVSLILVTTTWPGRSAGAAIPVPKPTVDRLEPQVEMDGTDARVSSTLVLLERGRESLKLDFVLRGAPATTPKTVRISFYTSMMMNVSLHEGTRLSFLVDGRVMNLSHIKYNLVKPWNHTWDAEVPLSTFLRLAAASKIEGSVGTVDFKLSEEQIESLRQLARKLPLPAVPAV